MQSSARRGPAEPDCKSFGKQCLSAERALADARRHQRVVEFNWFIVRFVNATWSQCKYKTENTSSV
jgi:hypothetical protein